jgi:hypothetical protein
MRRVEVLSQLHLQANERHVAFDLDLGALASLMAQGEPSIRRTMPLDSVDRLRPIAARFGYALTATPASNGLWNTALEHRTSGRPRLRLV